jgi:hypothetical protein
MTVQFTTLTISYGKHRIPIEVCYEERNQLAITVRPDMTVEARAPLGSEADKVQKKLDAKAHWIWGQLDHFEKYQPLQPPREYVGGETHLYLGRQFRLKPERSDREQVRLVGKFFHVETKHPKDTSQVKALMLDWYQRHAKAIIRRRIAPLLSEVERYDAAQPEIRIQWMKRRWGSCTPNGVMTFNVELVKAPVHCVDYVLMHELCHLVHPNHGSEFYRLLNILMPDWQKRKERLERVTI